MSACPEKRRLKYAVEGCFNGVWGDEPNGTDDLVVVRVADFDREKARVALSETPTVRAVPLSARNRRVLCRGDLLIEKSGGGEQQPVGNVVLFDEDVQAVCSNFVARLPVASNCDPRFVAYAFRAMYEQGRNVPHIKQTSGIQNLDSESYLNETVWLPRRDEQQRVADFLDGQTARIDALIAEKVRLRDALSEQANALVYALVTRGLKAPSMSPTHVSWLREVPSHWSVARIKHVARLESGHTPDKKVDAYWQDCDIPWVSLNDTGRLLEVDYITETSFNVNQLGIDNSSARLLPAGTVFFSRDATIGRCGIAARPMACSQHFIGWVCGARLYPEYLLFALRSMAGELERVTMGATLKTIGMDDVKALSIPLPPMAEQRAIVDEAKLKRQHLKDLSQHTTAFVDSLREYRSSLISAAVTGQLDISTFKAAA